MTDVKNNDTKKEKRDSMVSRILESVRAKKDDGEFWYSDEDASCLIRHLYMMGASDQWEVTSEVSEQLFRYMEEDHGK